MTPLCFIMLVALFISAIIVVSFTFENAEFRKYRKFSVGYAILVVLFGWLVTPWAALGVEKVWYWNMAMVNNHNPATEVIPPETIKVNAPIKDGVK